MVYGYANCHSENRTRLKAALSQIDCSYNFLIFGLEMRIVLRKCLETGDIRLLKKDQITVFHIYVYKLMFNG